MRTVNAKELDDLWDTRCGLEAVAARLAANFITDSEIRRLRVLCRRRERASENNDIRGANQADIAFHQQIVTISRNVAIQQVFGNTRLLERVFALSHDNSVYEVDIERSPFGHHQIVDALAHRNPELSERLLTQHIQAAKKRALPAIPAKAAAKPVSRPKSRRSAEERIGDQP